MSAIPIKELNAYSMAQIQQSLNNYYAGLMRQKAGNKDSQGRPISSFQTPDLRTQYKAGQSYGIEDEYRYLTAQKGFVGERAAGAAQEETPEETSTTSTNTTTTPTNDYQPYIESISDSIARSGKIKTHYGAGNLFGDADYGVAIGEGISNKDILQFLNSDMSRLSQGEKNQPGGGGLYDKILAAAQQEQLRDTGLQKYRADADRLAAEQSRYINDLQIQQNERMSQLAAEQERKSRELASNQLTYQQNQSRSGQLGALQIAGSSETPRTGGTQGFKRRKLQINPVTANALSDTLGGPSTTTKKTNVLNV